MILNINYPREKYRELSKTIRRNIMVNSECAFSRRFEFGKRRSPVLMAGLAVEYEELMGVSCRDNDLIEVSQLVARGEWEKQKAESGEVPDETDWKVDQLELKLFDGSGFIEVLTVLIRREEDIEKIRDKVKKGEIIFVIGLLMPINSPAGYFLLSEMILSEEELALYKHVYAAKFKEYKLSADLIKSSPLKPAEASDILCYPRNNMEIIRLFLSNRPDMEQTDYFYLACTAYEMFTNSPSLKTALMVMKYFRRRNMPDTIRFDETMHQEMFNDLYPDVNKYIEDKLF